MRTPVQNRKHGPNSKHGFTVMEMLIVTVVIVILATILVPVLKGAKERARQTQCSANMHALFVIWQQKRGDDSDVLKPGSNARLHWPEWPAGFYGYAKAGGQSRDVFLCPSDPNPYQSPLAVIGRMDNSGATLQNMYGVEEPVLDFPFPVPNPRTVSRKWHRDSNNSSHRITIDVHSNETATLKVEASSFSSSYPSIVKLFDETRTNSLGNFALANATVANVPTMKSSYGYNAIDIGNSATNSCQTGGGIPDFEPLGWPDDATRVVLLMDYPVSHVRAALCYAWNAPSGVCVSCRTNDTPTPGFADNWDNNAMGPLIGRHNGKCNVIFQDGSLEAFRPADIDPRAHMWQVVVGGGQTITNRLWRSVYQEHDNWTGSY